MINRDGRPLTSSEKNKRYRAKKQKEEQEFLQSLVKRMEFKPETGKFIELHPDDPEYYNLWYETSDYFLWRLKLLENQKNQTADGKNEVRVLEKILKQTYSNM